MTDLTFSDPAIQVGEFQGIVVKERRKRFYETQGFAVGVGLRGSLVEFKDQVKGFDLGLIWGLKFLPASE